MMRAALYDATGGPEVLYVGESPDPVPGAGEVVLRVAAAGLNPFDSKLRSGFIPSQAPFPRRIGGDVAGTVEAVGEDARYADGSPIAVGDEVLGRADGAVAERVTASASGLARRPDAVPATVAGGLDVAGLTAVSCLVSVPLTADDTVLVGGASGAVGLLVCQLAAVRGARVIGSASERHHDFLRSIGAEPVTYGEGLVDRVRQLGMITAVIDCHGREGLDAGVALGVPVGRMTAIAAYGALSELGVADVDRSARTADALGDLAERIAAGTLSLPVAAAFPLDEIAAAFAALDAPHDPGKIVVVP